MVHSLEFVEVGLGRDAQWVRQATTCSVDSIRRAYVSEVRSLPPARPRLLLISGGPFEVAAAGLRNLHILAAQLASCCAETIEISGSTSPLSWTLRFSDASVLTALKALDESTEPAVSCVRRVRGIFATLYYVVLQQGATLDYHWAGHLGAGLANRHATVLRAHGQVPA